MNFTKFKYLSPEDKMGLLSESFHRKHGETYLRKLIKAKPLNITDNERVALIASALIFILRMDLKSFEGPVPWPELAEAETLGGEVIHYFKKFMPYVFGFHDGVRSVEGLVSWTARHFAGGMDTLIFYLVYSDLSNTTVPKIVDHLSSQQVYHIDEKAIDNCIRRNF